MPVVCLLLVTCTIHTYMYNVYNMHFVTAVTCMLYPHALHMTITSMLQANMHVRASNMNVTRAGFRIGSRVERTASEREYLAEDARLSLASYHAIPLGTAPNCSFPVRLKTKKSWSRFNSVHIRTFGT